MFLDEDYLLDNEAAKDIYFNYVKDLPIFDYHCHVSPREIFEDRPFSDYTAIGLSSDHYKWRLLRGEGFPEEEITGDAEPFTKFYNFCRLMPKLAGNPVYVWTHLEIRRYFGYFKPLSEATAEEAWEHINAAIVSKRMSPRYFIGRSGVCFIGTTDDPCDDLSWHSKIASDSTFKTAVAPSFRPDKAVDITRPDYARYISSLGEVCGMNIASPDDLKNALTSRILYFKERGMLASDHGLAYIPEKPSRRIDLGAVFAKVLGGGVSAREESDAFIFDMLTFLAGEYHRNDIVMQIHYGAGRNVNSRSFRALGPDTGFDTIGPKRPANGLADFLDELEKDGRLPKVVVYSLDPCDNALIDSVIGAFQSRGVKGKVQHGAAWWFNDTKRGITDHLQSLSGLSVLGNFIGMLTDSRSFLSYVRHDYFRRILCGYLGRLAEEGSYPMDRDALARIAAGVSFFNAVEYFGFKPRDPALKDIERIING